MNPFLEDLAAEKTREAIEFGNLHRRRPDPGKIPPPTLIPQWEDIGYQARITMIECLGCGDTHLHLDGVFLKQKSTNLPGDCLRYKQIPLETVRLLKITPEEVIQTEAVPLCASCVSSTPNL